MKVELRKSYWLESSRHLPFLAKTHPCSKVHGHSFQLTYILQGELNEGEYWLTDYHEIDKQTEDLRRKLDHASLNDIMENPTTELLAIWIFENTKKVLPGLKQVILSETRDTECRYPA